MAIYVDVSTGQSPKVRSRQPAIVTTVSGGGPVVVPIVGTGPAGTPGPPGGSVTGTDGDIVVKSGTGVVTTNIDTVLGVNVLGTRYGATGNGTTDDRTAVAAADTAATGSVVAFPPGHYKFASNLTITNPVRLAVGAYLEPTSGVTVTLAAGVTATPFTTVFAGAGTVKIGKPQTVTADWWGAKSTSTTIARAVAGTAQGSRIELAGKYTSGTITMAADEVTGLGDQNKALVGIGGPGIRTKTAPVQWGAEIYLAAGTNANLLTLTGAAADLGPGRCGFVLDNIKFDGAKSSNTAGHCISLALVKDLYVGRILVSNAYATGFAVVAQCDQFFINHLEANANGDRGIDLGGTGDTHCNFMMAGGSGGVGVNISGGVQCNQIHSYVNGDAGVLIQGGVNSLGSIRSNTNTNEGIRITGTDTQISSVLVFDNGTNTALSAAARSGVLFKSTSTRNQIGVINAQTTPGGTQQYGVRYDSALTGTDNVVNTYVGTGNGTADASISAAAALLAGNRILNGWTSDLTSKIATNTTAIAANTTAIAAFVSPPGPGFCSTLGNLAGTARASTVTTAKVVTANDAIAAPFAPDRSFTINKLVWFSGGASGNYDIGIYDESGAALWRLGSTTFPATGAQTLTVSPGVAVSAGTRYWTRIAVDNTTATFRGIVIGTTSEAIQIDGTHYARTSAAAAFPLPSSLAISTNSSLTIPYVILRNA